jgi:hypothetical protein
MAEFMSILTVQKKNKYMKAYITCPCSHNQDYLKILPLIKNAVEKNNIEPLVFTVGGDPKDVFSRDYNALKSCSLLIAEVSERSHGVGIEIGLSYSLGLKRILLIKEGKFVTKLAEGLPETIIIQYKNEHDLVKKLDLALKNYG